MVGGLCTVQTTIISHELNVPTFHKWYESHLNDDILKVEGIPIASRWETSKPGARRFLAMYPVQDVNVFKGDGWNGLPHTSEILPYPHTFDPFMDFDTRYYELVTSDKPATTKPHSKFLKTFGITPTKGSEADFESWVTGTLLPALSKSDKYHGSMVFKFAYAEDDVDLKIVTSYYVCSEFESHVSLDYAEVAGGKEILESATLIDETDYDLLGHFAAV